MTAAKPALRPNVPHFSSGPCAKRPGWNPQNLKDAALGRSHRAKIGKARLKLAIELTREVLEVPTDYRIGIVPASDTGAVEMALWSLLGARPVTTIAWESFGEGWVSDIVKELKLKDVTKLHAAYGEIPDLSKADPASDIVFTWNGTTSGVRVPNADWIAADREGLTICDATSAAFAQPLDLLLAEGAGRRGRARHAGAFPARGGAAGELQAGVAAAKNLPHDQGRQAQRRHL
jgi:phosphoserine aminotransferase